MFFSLILGGGIIPQHPYSLAHLQYCSNWQHLPGQVVCVLLSLKYSRLMASAGVMIIFHNFSAIVSAQTVPFQLLSAYVCLIKRSKYHYQAKIQTAPENPLIMLTSLFGICTKHYFGYDSFRGQQQIVEQALKIRICWLLCPLVAENPCVFNCQHCWSLD